jgi:catechol 2,3-dioxygenase-like lactoylglutathione lyase family enzyme
MPGSVLSRGIHGMIPPRVGTLNHLRFSVTDIPRAEAFYSPFLRLLGYRLVERSATRLAWAGLGPCAILQWLIVSLADPSSPNKRHDRYSPGLHHVPWNAERRAQVDACHALLVRQGAAVLNPPAEYDYEPGYYAVFFADPDGLKLEVVHVPAEGSERYWKAFEERGGPIET